MNLDEGQSGKVTLPDELIYPNINSCLSVTMVLNDGTRIGGHAILIPEPGQQNLNNILTYITNNAPEGQRVRLYVIGDIDTWNQNLDGIRDNHDIPVDAHDIVGYIQGRLPVPNTIQRDTEGRTYDVCFGTDRRLVLFGHGAGNINLPNW
jgi:hypothetical protein